MFGDVLEKKTISIAKAKDILAKIKKPNYEQKVSFEYASKFAKVSGEDADKLLQELQEAEIPRMKERHFVKLIDIMPKNADEIKTLLAKEDLTLNKEDADKILEILKKYR